MLQLFFVTGGRCLNDRLNLIQVDFYSSLGDHEPQEFVCAYAENALRRVKLNVVPLHQVEDFLQVVGMFFSSFAFYHYAINVHFHRVTDQGLEDLCHQSLVGGADVFESMRHYKGSFFPRPLGP